MALSDPRGGTPYIDGNTLPASDVNTVWAQQPRALDAVNGGTYVTGTAVNVSGVKWTLDNPVDLGGAVKVKTSGTLEIDGPTKWPLVGSRSLPYRQPLAVIANTDDRFGWSANFNWLQTDTAGIGGLFIPMTNLPARGTMTRVILTLNGGSSHSSLPATMPKFRVYQKLIATDTPTLLGTATDNSPSVLAYEIDHEVELPSLTATVDHRHVYYVRFDGEAGANSINGGLRLKNIAAEVTVTEIGA